MVLILVKYIYLMVLVTLSSFSQGVYKHFNPIEARIAFAFFYTSSF